MLDCMLMPYVMLFVVSVKSLFPWCHVSVLPQDSDALACIGMVTPLSCAQGFHGMNWTVLKGSRAAHTQHAQTALTACRMSF